MDSRKAYELMKEDYVDKESAELCNQIEKQLEITFIMMVNLQILR